MRVSLPTIPRRRLWPLLSLGLLLIGASGLLLYWRSALWPGDAGRERASQPADTAPAGATPKPAEDADVVVLTRPQQEAIGLTVVPVVHGAATDVIEAPGQIVPDETKFAYITPRAGGIVRTVAARVGQDVEAGTLLALIDSPDVSKARFDLATAQQEREIADTQAQWEKKIYENTRELVERLRAEDEPDAIQKRFQDRPIGGNREQLLTAYANYRLQRVALRRNEELIKERVITPKQYQEVRASFETAQATYQGLMDQMDFNNTLAYARAQQNLKRAETAVRVARAQLRVLGVPPDGSQPEIRDGKVVGVGPDGILHVEPGLNPESVKTEPMLVKGDSASESAVAPVGTPAAAAPKPQDLPVSTYALWAPFDGTVLDRELIVPGVFVDTTHRIFTLADLSSVWIEVAIHESHYKALTRSRDAVLLVSSPAYPNRTFEAKVIYTGDLVDPKSRTIKLLARAQNPERLLKPGMFIEVELRLKGGIQAPLIPEAALLTEADRAIVFVQTGPERFERRRVQVGASDGDKVAILQGLTPGEKVVEQGGFKLKSIALIDKK